MPTPFEAPEVLHEITAPGAGPPSARVRSPSALTLMRRRSPRRNHGIVEGKGRGTGDRLGRRTWIVNLEEDQRWNRYPRGFLLNQRRLEPFTVDDVAGRKDRDRRSADPNVSEEPRDHFAGVVHSTGLTFGITWKSAPVQEPRR